jgi:4,5:9,10-diseco-3-hydroxy-5,9,17-trioxoandrosta-1(10),2-diene-4-oate hydrolase
MPHSWSCNHRHGYTPKEAAVPATTLPDQYIQVGPVRTRFWTAGEGETTLVLLHGLGSYVEDWQENILPLARHDRVYALDLVGCGRSAKPRGPYTLDSLAGFAGEFLAGLGVRRATLVGHSLGGAVAMQLASRSPALVERLVLVSSAGLGREAGLLLRLSTVPLLGEWLTRPRREGLSRYFRQTMHDPSSVTAEWVETCSLLAALPGAQRAMLATLRTTMDLRGVREAVFRPLLAGLAHLAVPTLVVWGQQDPILPVAHAHAAQRQLPSAQLHIFDPCGHFPQLECAAEFNALVQEFAR